MIFRFNNLPQNGEALISIDNLNFMPVTCARMNVDLSNGLHKIKVIFKSFNDVKRQLAFLSKKNPHLICLNTSINSFEQEFCLWVKKQGYRISCCVVCIISDSLDDRRYASKSQYLFNI